MRPDRARFVVTSVAGFNAGGRWASAFQVLDRAYCHQVVYATKIERVARAGAAIMNAGDLDWPHGHLTTHVHGYTGRPPCPCDVCARARVAWREARRERARGLR